MFFHGRSVFAVAFLLVGGARHGSAVCASGQMAVGVEELEMFTGPNRAFNVYNGFLMTNACKTIASNGATEASDQLCQGGYTHGASVSCSGGKPTSAVDTQGNAWTCSPTSDSSCNVGGSGGSFHVIACCTRK